MDRTYQLLSIFTLGTLISFNPCNSPMKYILLYAYITLLTCCLLFRWQMLYPVYFLAFSFIYGIFSYIHI